MTPDFACEHHVRSGGGERPGPEVGGLRWCVGSPQPVRFRRPHGPGGGCTGDRSGALCAAPQAPSWVSIDEYQDVDEVPALWSEALATRGGVSEPRPLRGKRAAIDLDAETAPRVLGSLRDRLDGDELMDAWVWALRTACGATRMRDAHGAVEPQGNGAETPRVWPQQSPQSIGGRCGGVGPRVTGAGARARGGAARYGKRRRAT